jgi:hypothetical protein
MVGQTVAWPGSPGWRFAANRIAARSSLVVMAATAVLGSVYLVWTPQAPDLAAQIARADVARAGVTTWWSGWYGGFSLPTYSLLTPALMAAVGAPLAGVLAVGAGAGAGLRLTEGCLRPRIGAVAFAIFSLANLLDGRVTFAVGLAFASWAAVALRANHRFATAILSLATFAASPLAGLFLGVVVAVVVVLQPPRRASAAVSSAALLGSSVGTAFLFPGTGTMPFSVLHALPPAACCLAVLILCPSPLVRGVALALLGLFVLCLVVRTPVGGNITRLVWLAAVPTVLACAPAPRWLLPLSACALAIWPASDLVGQLHAGAARSAHASFYQPLLNEIRQEQSLLGAKSNGQRLELVDTANHWGNVYLGALPLARGWDRQADAGYNAIFYSNASLTASSYHAWLDSLAVRWVAVPAATLDYAAVAEAKLVHGGLDYLKLVWSTPDWTLYQVVEPAPLVSGAQLLRVTATTMEVQTAGAATVTIRQRWSPYVALTDPVSGQPASGCVIDNNGWVNVVVARAEQFELSDHFDPRARLSGSSRCVN